MIADRAEFAAMVRSDWHGRALGFRLMQTLIRCADRRRVGMLDGDVLRENTTVLLMARELGVKVVTNDAPKMLPRRAKSPGPIQHRG